MADTTHVLLCTLLLTLLAAILLKLKLRTTAFFSRENDTNLPPGPWTLPVIGSMHCLLGSLPHHALRRLAGRYGPVMLLRVGHVRMLVLSSPEAAREVMKTHDAVFASRPLSPTMDIITYGGKGVALSPYGQRWKELRKICAVELFSPRRVRSFRRIREAEAARLVRSVAASPTWPLVNVSEHVAAMMNDVIMITAVGRRCPRQEEYLEELSKVSQLLAGFNMVDLFPESRLVRALSGGSLRAAEATHEKIHSIMDAMIQDHVKAMERRGEVADGGDGEEARKREEDLLDILLRLQRDGGLGITLTTEIIIATVFDILAGGSETTATTVMWAMSELMRCPRAMQRAQFEVRQVMEGKNKVDEADIGGSLHYLQSVIKETLRLHLPFPLLLPRLCTKTCKIMGYDVPNGTMVIVNDWAISRDERCWEDAEDFRPERFEHDGADYNGTDFRFLPGGSGRRMCPGLMFAQYDIEIALASLLYHFDWELPGGDNQKELDMSESAGLTASRRSDLWLKATPFVSTA